jgi:hypothetical protein
MIGQGAQRLGDSSDLLPVRHHYSDVNLDAP